MPGDMLGQSIAYRLLKLLQYVSRYRQINSPTDDLTEDKVLKFGVEGLIPEDDQIDHWPTFCAPTDQILTNIAVSQLDTAIPFESRPSNYGTDNFIKAKEILSGTRSSTYGDSQ